MAILTTWQAWGLPLYRDRFMSMYPTISNQHSSFSLAPPYLEDGVPSSIRSKRILRKKHLAEKLDCSESTIDNRLNPSSKWHDESFPRPVPLGAGGSRSSAKGWLEYVIDEWLESRQEDANRR